MSETVNARDFQSHLAALAGVGPDDALLAEAIAVCGLTEATEYTGVEMQAIENAIAQKIQLKLAVSNDVDFKGLKNLISSVNRMVASRQEKY